MWFFPNWFQKVSLSQTSQLVHMLVFFFQAVDGDLGAYSGIMKNLRKDADDLMKIDREDAKNIAAKQVWFALKHLSSERPTQPQYGEVKVPIYTCTYET